MAFGINKTFFQSLGGFDLGMKVWGAEQYELSIKVYIITPFTFLRLFDHYIYMYVLNNI